MSKREDYLCLECGYIFDSPVPVVEPHGERYTACPHCLGWDFVHVVECDGCGEIIKDDYVHLDRGEDFCAHCFCRKSIEAGE